MKPERTEKRTRATSVRLNTDHSISTNHYISINITKKCCLEKQLYVDVIVAFDWYETRHGFVGMKFACVKGFLDGCMAQVFGDNAKYSTVDEKVRRRLANSRHKYGVVKAPRKLVGTGGLSYSKKKYDSVTSESRVKRKSVVFSEHAKGVRPEWHFRGEDTWKPPLLSGPQAFTIKFNFNSSSTLASGVFSAETFKHLTVINEVGEPVSLLQHWLGRARAHKDIIHDTIKVSFEVQ